MKGGYFMVDLGGLDLTSASSQSTSALYPQLQAAMKQGKPVVGYNSKFGSGKPATPVALTLFQYDTTTVYAYTGVLQIAVTASAAAVTDLTSA